jgi:hypothetical protein
VKAPFIAIISAIVLSGCALGVQSGGTSPSVTYTAPRPYQTVYLRVQSQAELCLRGNKDQYDVYAEIDPVSQAGSVSVRGPLSDAVLARTDIKAVDHGNTQVTHTVWGHKPWDEAALSAMRRSVMLDTSVCVAYKTAQ